MKAWVIEGFDGAVARERLYVSCGDFDETCLKQLLSRLLCQHESSMDIARATCGQSTLLDVYVDRRQPTGPQFTCGEQFHYIAVQKDVNPAKIGTHEQFETL